ncbi:MAG TPA: PLP-dependent transferase [Spirochaetota bacterium]|nr:PLP-dependent transferase [Spirochaetota bacterium]HSA14975.1 PLP-dependent transferase [Spirochaetota bacterium]
MKYDTMILHGAADHDAFTGALSIPVYPASTYRQADVDGGQDYYYSRAGNPTRRALEETLAVLEGGECGYAFASGMAAVTAALTAVLKAGDHVVATKDIYGGSYRLFTQFLGRFGVSHTFADTSDIAATEDAIRPETRALFLESPSNPVLKIIDFESMAALAKRRGLVSMVDNTFLSPYFFRPLEYGIDLSIHSASKFLGGHSDLIAGAVVARDRNLGREVGFVQSTTGSMLSPENSWLLLRGIKTLGVRMKAQAEGAMKIAHWLSGRDWVNQVFYPGLPSHPGHDIITRQASGYGAVVSFVADSKERAAAIMKNVRTCTVAVSLGGVESILSYPAKMSHAAIPEPEREKLGINWRLLRLSVGLEDPDDLIDDIDRAACSM